MTELFLSKCISGEYKKGGDNVLIRGILKERLAAMNCATQNNNGVKLVYNGKKLAYRDCFLVVISLIGVTRQTFQIKYIFMSVLWKWLFNRAPTPERRDLPALTPPFKTITMYKVILLGDSGCGKTSILNMISHKTFKSNYKATIGADFIQTKIPVDQTLMKGYTCDGLGAMIWDTAGPERYQSLGVAFYRGAEAVILAYDISNTRSFDNVGRWIDEFKEQQNSEVVTVIVGNKKDLERKVPYHSGLEIARRYGALFFECAANDYDTVLPMFIELTTAVYLKDVLGDVEIEDGRIQRHKRMEFRHIILKLRTNGSFCDISIETCNKM